MQSFTEFVLRDDTECDPEDFRLNFFEHQFVLSWDIEKSNKCSFIVNISKCSMSQTAPFPCILNVTADVHNDSASLTVKNCIEQNKHYPNGVKIFIKEMDCNGLNECSSEVYIPIPEKGNNLIPIFLIKLIYIPIYFYRNNY